MLIFSWLYLKILMISLRTFKRVKCYKFFNARFWLIMVDWQTKKNLDLGPSSPNCAKPFKKILPITIFISWPSFSSKWFTIQKIGSKMYSTLCADNCHDVTTSDINGMIFSRCVLTHLFPIYPFSTHWKYQKTWRSSDVSRG